MFGSGLNPGNGGTTSTFSLPSRRKNYARNRIDIRWKHGTNVSGNEKSEM